MTLQKPINIISTAEPDYIIVERELGLDSDLEPGPEPEPEQGPKTEPEPSSGSGPEPEPELEPESVPEPGPEPGPEPSTEPDPELNPETGPEIGLEPDPEPGPELGPEPHSETSPESSPETHPEPDSEVSQESNVNSNSESNPELVPVTEVLKEQVNDLLKVPLRPRSPPPHHPPTDSVSLTGIRDIRQHLFIKDLRDLGYLVHSEEGYYESPSKLLVNNYYSFEHQTKIPQLTLQTKATQKIKLKQYNNYAVPKHHPLRQSDDVKQEYYQTVTTDLTWPTFSREETKNHSTEIDWENFDEEKLFLK